MLTFRYTRRVEQALLRKQDKRFFRAPALGNSLLARRNLIHGSSNMQCSGAPAFLRSPGNWRIQSPVDLEYTRTILVFLKFPSVTWRKFISCKAQQLLGRYIDQYHTRRRQVAR